MGNRIVVLRPNSDTAVSYGEHYLQEVLDRAKEKGFKVTDLRGWKDNIIFFLFSVPRASYVCGIGHGNETMLSGNWQLPLMKKGSKLTKRLAKRKDWSLLSCSMGKELAPYMVKEGEANSVNGYDDVFYFRVSKFPDGKATPFFESHIAYDLAYINGVPPVDAFDVSQEKFKEWHVRADKDCKPYLLHDMKCHKIFVACPHTAQIQSF